ncbi:MAG: IS1634 family transposase [Desulfobacterales bacterium]|nr:IS1634 family transposase [Desulfobacterales bacterium]
MFIQGIPRRGHTYYAVISGKRVDGKVVRKTEYYIGRLEKLDEARRVEIEENLKNLGDSALIQKFRSIIISQGYEFPSPISFFSVEKIYEYGRELAIHKVCEEIDFVNLINKHGKKGGGPDLGKVVEAMVINRNCDPHSYFQLPEWYKRSALPLFMDFPSSQLTYSVALNALDYLQPENTVPMQVDIYEKIRKVYGYECDRIDIDLTSTYFEGEECILAEFGYSRDHRSDRPQIVIAFAVDQKGIPVTHNVWPGNRTDAKSLKPFDRCLNKEFNLDAPRIVDRGIATWENLNYMDRKKERYLVALRAKIKSTGFLEAIGTSPGDWAAVRDNEVAASIIKDKRKYVVVWNADVADTNRKDRESRVRRAERELEKLKVAVENGRIRSREKRDEKIGHIKNKYKVNRYLATKNCENSFGFEIERTESLQEAQRYDGYQIFVTTELDLSEREIVESYRVRDQIEKAIQTLKSVLGLHPQYVRTKEHVLGNIFVCTAAYQLRSILRMKLKDKGIDMSIDEAMKALEQLKAVQIVVGKNEEVQVHRKLGGVNEDTRILIDVFNMEDNGELPLVGTLT